MARIAIPRYELDKDALLAVEADGDPADFDAMLRLQAGGFLDDALEITAEGRAAAAAVRAQRERRARERTRALAVRQPWGR